MKHECGDSSGSARIGERYKIVGLPKQCWCGEKVLLNQSKSGNNPQRRYYRCAYATYNTLKDDKHLFKWLDDAMLSELEELNSKIAMLDGMVNEISIENKEIEKLFDKFEEIILEKVDNVMVETKSKIKSAMMISFGGFLIIGLLIKLIL